MLSANAQGSLHREIGRAGAADPATRGPAPPRAARGNPRTIGRLLAFLAPAALGPAASAAQADLSSGFVSPASGQATTTFTYSVKYSNSSNVRPDYVWVGIWWGSRGATYWYEMAQATPSDTNYTDGAWYAYSITGLDPAPHAFRFVAQVSQVLLSAPEPAGSYQSGPTVTGLPVLMGLVSVTSEDGPGPSLSFQADKQQVENGGYVTFTATVSLSGAVSRSVGGVTVAYRPDPMFTPLDGTASVVVQNGAGLAWSAGWAQTRLVGSRVAGRTATIMPAGGIFIVRCGDFAPGDVAVCTFRCQAGTGSTGLVASAGPDKTIALGGSTVLQGSAWNGTTPYKYSWTPTTGLSSPTAAQPTASPTATTTYTLTVTDTAGLKATDRVTVTIGVNNAEVLSTIMPASMVRGAWQTVRVTLRNTGMTTWTAADGYGLSSVDPTDNTTWGVNRVALNWTDSIAPGQDKTFIFTITAPDTVSAGVSCDWQMIHQGIGRFGAISSQTVGVSTFADVPTTVPHWRYVEALYRAGITGGCASDDEGRPLFCASATLTRKEAAVFLVRAAGKTPLIKSRPTFADVPASVPYYGHVERLADSASWYDKSNPCLTTPTKGCDIEPLRYCPDATVTRAMLAVYLCRARGKCPWNNPTPTFADVAPSSPCYGFIERLADPTSWNNDPPTRGCAIDPVRFCPDDAATRATMAVALVRAFGIPY